MLKTQFNRRLLLTVVALCICIQGCHRGYYRRQADAEARRLITQKSDDPRWDSESGSIAIDPQSRMFSPFSKDHPPIPPDDPTSHQLMNCVDGKEGYPHWNSNGNTNYVANPEWRAYLPINENGEVVINLERAFQLALIHSPDLQQQRENLYLSALDVSLERFGFDSQLFVGFNSFLNSQGRFRNGDDRSRSQLSTQLGSNGQGITLQQLGTTGTNFAVGIANTILWNFAGPSTQSATSLVDFSLIQPLLLDAGRARIMESLTQAERTLLANVRQMSRFRRGFYLQIITGRNAGAGPNRGGNFLGLPAAATANVDGYLGLLFQQQDIRIQEFNVRQLENVLEQFREFYLRERVDSLQVRQFENTLYSAQRRLLQSKTNYENSLDRFKRDLGLPPDLVVVISDPSLEQFELISNGITKRSNDLTDLKNDTGETLIQLGDKLPEMEEGDNPPPIDWPEDLNESVQALDQFIAKAQQLIQLVKERDQKEIEEDLKRLSVVRPKRIGYLEKLRGAIERGEMLSDIETSILQPKSIRGAEELRNILNALVKQIEGYEKDLEQTRAKIRGFAEKRDSFANDKELHEYIRVELLETIPEQLNDFSSTLLELSLLQAQSRANSVELQNVELDSQTAMKIARCFRRDLMNARASLVDQWREIEFVANQLESQLDLVFEGDIGNVGDNPFKLRYETGQLRAGFRFDAPIVRLSERNQYRESLIEYSQSRRAFYQFEDEINRNLRQILRNLDLNKVLYEVNRKSIQISIEEVELARFKLEEPARAGATRSSLGATTANDLTRALNGLQSAQQEFLNTWVTYEVLRRSLDFDMGTMQLDSMGQWIDPGEIDGSIAARAASMMGVSIENICRDLVDYDDFTSNEPLPGDMIIDPNGSNNLEQFNNDVPLYEGPEFEPPQLDTAPRQQPIGSGFKSPSYFAPHSKPLSSKPIVPVGEAQSTRFQPHGSSPVDPAAAEPEVHEEIKAGQTAGVNVKPLDDLELVIKPIPPLAAPAVASIPPDDSHAKIFFGPLDQLKIGSDSALESGAGPIAVVDQNESQNGSHVIQVTNLVDVLNDKTQGK